MTTTDPTTAAPAGPPREEREARYLAEKRSVQHAASMTFMALGAVAFVVLAATGRILWARQWAPPSPGDHIEAFAVVALVVVVFQALTVPFNVLLGHVIPRRYGLSGFDLGPFLAHQARALCLTFVTVAGTLTLIYVALSWLGVWWWAPAAGAYWALSLLWRLATVAWLRAPWCVPPEMPDDELRRRLFSEAERMGFVLRHVYLLDARSMLRAARPGRLWLPLTHAYLALTDTAAEADPAAQVADLAVDIAHVTRRDAQRDELARLGLLAAAFLATAILAPVAIVLVGAAAQKTPAGVFVTGAVLALLMGQVHRVTTALGRRNAARSDWCALDATQDPLAFLRMLRSTARRYPDVVASPPRAARRLSVPPLRDRADMAVAWATEHGVAVSPEEARL